MVPSDEPLNEPQENTSLLPEHSPLRHPDIEREWLVRGLEQLRIYERAEGYLNDALQALHDKRYLEAIGHFRSALEQHPEYPEVHYFLGITHFLLSQYQEAAKQYLETMHLEPKHYGARLQLGVVHHLLEDYPRAIEAFEQAIQLNPGLSEAHVRLGNAHAAAGNRQQAVSAYAEALRMRLQAMLSQEKPVVPAEEE